MAKKSAKRASKGSLTPEALLEWVRGLRQQTAALAGRLQIAEGLLISQATAAAASRAAGTGVGAGRSGAPRAASARTQARPATRKATANAAAKKPGGRR